MADFISAWEAKICMVTEVDSEDEPSSEHEEDNGEESGPEEGSVT